jgi:hypothetical protein
MSLALNVFWLLPIPVLTCIAVVMYRRKQHLIYAIFWSYILFQGVRIPAEFICKVISYKAYFYSYWIASFTSVVLGLLLLRDIFRRVLRNYSALDRMRRTGYDIALICFWLAALLLAFRLSPAHNMFQRIATAELVVSFTAVGILVFVVVASIVLGIKWRSAVCGMAAGLGLLGTIDLAVFAAVSRLTLHSRHVMLVSWIETLGFDFAMGLFAVYFLPRRKEVDPPRSLKPELLEWSESMKGAMPK